MAPPNLLCIFFHPDAHRSSFSSSPSLLLRALLSLSYSLEGPAGARAAVYTLRTFQLDEKAKVCSVDIDKLD